MIFYLKRTCLTRVQIEYVDAILASADDLLKLANSIVKKPKVLLVEDNPIIQRVHQYMLSDLGCETEIAKDGAEALVLGRHDYDLIFLDIGLPDLNGIEVAKKLRRYPNHIHTPILALTAHVDAVTKKNCLEAGVVRVLHKPVEFNTLAEMLRDYNLISEESQ